MALAVDVRLTDRNFVLDSVLEYSRTGIDITDGGDDNRDAGERVFLTAEDDWKDLQLDETKLLDREQEMFTQSDPTGFSRLPLRFVISFNF